MEFATPYSGVLWSLEILLQNFGTTLWSFQGEFHCHAVEFLFLTLTPFNGILLEFSLCVKNIEIEIRIYRKSAILWSNILRNVKALICFDMTSQSATLICK